MAKILAVDDSVSMRNMVSFTLRGAGHDVHEAADGKAALDAAKAGRFDLVLADVNMPVMDGITLTRELRALPSFAGVPILILTTESDAGKKMEGKAAGATGWLVKPFDPEQLLATVARVAG
jgi:two-component system chemotaxis response regulator CheY